MFIVVLIDLSWKLVQWKNVDSLNGVHIWRKKENIYCFKPFFVSKKKHLKKIFFSINNEQLQPMKMNQLMSAISCKELAIQN